MYKLIYNSIEFECEKLIRRYYEYLFYLNETIQRKSTRIGQCIHKQILQPNYWNIANGFNPFIVKKRKNINTYAYTINNKIKDFSYQPKTAIIHPIPKDSGGVRNLNIFQIPDASISRYIYKSLLKKNATLFSSYSYAYRDDRNAHDAILKITSDWKNLQRIYIAEFDFSKFFDTISHKYVLDILKNNYFLYTDYEDQILQSFLTSSYAEEVSYNDTQTAIKRDKGIPQGTSISLFLANLACWELDKELESLGVRFARYADDTLIWSNSYSKIVKAFDLFNQFSQLIGVTINIDKSDGISIISIKSSEEMKTKGVVKYLGYSINLRSVSIAEKSVQHIKEKISYIIYSNLLQPINSGIYNKNRLSHIDWDYLVTISQIRRYLYGGLNDSQLQRYRLGIITKLHFRGLMSYYPLVNDDKQLKMLDGWMIHTLQQALKKRQRLWKENQNVTLPGPKPDWINNITNIKQWVNPDDEKKYDLRIPSFLQINKTIRVGLKKQGVYGVTNPKSIYYPGYFPRKTRP